MTSTVREACRELVLSMLETVETLLALSQEELLEHSDHVCAQGKDVWTLITNDIDHEKIHAGQVLDARYEARSTQDRMARLLAEWLAERARLVGALAGLSDAQFESETAPGEWTYARIVRHVIAVERDSVRSIREAAAVRPAGG
jgi:hypothetical protein